MFRKNRSDLSNFLVHLTKNGSYEEWRPMWGEKNKGHFLFGDSEVIRAKNSLEDILKASSPRIEARSPFGVFKFIGINTGSKIKLNISPETLKAACFSETPLRELKSFYQSTQNEDNFNYKTNKYQKYGIAFESDFVRAKGGQPIFYYDRRNEKIRNSVEALGQPQFQQVTLPILPYFEYFGPKIDNPNKEIDFRWEREWRVVGDFLFSWDNIAFGICPEKEISDFENLVNKSCPFIDPDWSAEKLKEYLTKGNWNNLVSKI